MPHLLLNYRHVPDDEIDEVRELLDRHGVNYYETPPSRWGISVGGLWVRERDEAERARALFDEYQSERFNRSRADYENRLRSGDVEGIWQRFRARPLTMLAIFGAIAVVLYLSLSPFMGWLD